MPVGRGGFGPQEDDTISLTEHTLEADGAAHAATMATAHGLRAVVRETERLTRADATEPEAFVRGFIDEACWLVTVADAHVRSARTPSATRYTACG